MLLNCGVGEDFENPLDCKEIQPVHPKEISPEYSLEGLMLRLKLQYFGHLMWRTDSWTKTLMLGKIEGRGEGDDRGRDGCMASPTQWTWVWASSGSWWWTGNPGVLQSIELQRVRHDWVTELNIILNVHGAKPKEFLLRSGTRHECPLSLFPTQYWNSKLQESYKKKK